MSGAGHDAAYALSSCDTSAAVYGLLPGSRATSREYSETSAGGASGITTSRRGGSSSARRRITSMSVPAPHRRRPVRHSKSTAPTLNRSLRRSSFSPSACSGDMYAILPLTSPVRVSCPPVSNFATPKSRIFTCPS